MNTRLFSLTSAFALLGVTVGASPPRLLAQSALPAPRSSAVIRPGIPASDGELTPEVQARLTRADALTGARRWAVAQREYRAAAAVARAQGHLPSLTLWHLASAHYYQGDLWRAALVLRQLASEAARCGDLVAEALALFDAAWLDDQAGRRGDAAAEVAELKMLMRSPYLPPAVREYLEGRLTPPAAIIAKP